jgi:Tfp pilus assembly protein PilF
MVGFGLSYLRNLLLLGMIVFAVSGCQTVAPQNQVSCEPVQVRPMLKPSEKKLNYGVLSFEEGNYPSATIALQGVLDIASSEKQERVKAFKYLAFIQCVSGRELMCRDYFKKALEIDPSFNLDTAEAGHPIWGPVFRGIKSKLTK